MKDITYKNRPDCQPKNISYECGALACPNCNGDYLHQEAVAVFHRQREDEPAVPVIVGSQHHWRPTNPSLRRQGLVIRFNCENCAEHPELHIYQHKGRTFVEWPESTGGDYAVASSVAGAVRLARAELPLMEESWEFRRIPVSDGTWIVYGIRPKESGVGHGPFIMRCREGADPEWAVIRMYPTSKKIAQSPNSTQSSPRPCPLQGRGRRPQ